MPATKLRGILREYLQILILKEVYKTEIGNKLYFTGGTYLRLLHNLKRFSEDLDFNTDSIKENEFKNLLAKIKEELKKVNIESTVTFKKWGNIYTSNIVFQSIEKAYNIISKYSKKEGIVIKLETNRPKWNIRKETEVISGFGEFFPCVCTDRTALFADKIDALQKKTRGRHIYDIIFMLSNRYNINRDVMSSLGIKGDPLDAILNRISSFSNSELKKQAEGLRPFLFEESEANLLIKAHDMIPLIVGKYRMAEK